METVAKQIASSGASLVVRRFSVLATTAVSTAVIARMLGTDDYGRLQAALAVWTIALTVCDFGFGPVLIREFAARADDRGVLLRAGRDLQAVLGALGTLGFLAAGLLAGTGSQQGQIYLALAPSVAFSAYNGGRSYFLAVFETNRLVRIDVAVAIGQCAAVVAVAATTHDPVLIALATGLGTAVNALLVGLSAQRALGRSRAVRSVYLRMGRQVVPLGISSVVSRVYVSVDVVLLGWIALDSETAYYAGAVKLITFLNQLVGLVVSAALPGLSQLRDDKEALLRLTTRLMGWVGVTVLPGFLLTAVFARTACELLLGERFTPAAPLVAILAGAGIVATASQIFRAVLTALDIVKPMLYQNIAGVVVNVVGNLLLIPYAGAYAAAVLTLVTELIVCAGSMRTLNYRIPVRRTFRAVARPLLAAVPAAVVGSLLAGLPWIGIPAALATLALLFLVLRCWPAEFTPRRRP